MKGLFVGNVFIMFIVGFTGLVGIGGKSENVKVPEQHTACIQFADTAFYGVPYSVSSCVDSLNMPSYKPARTIMFEFPNLNYNE